MGYSKFTVLHHYFKKQDKQKGNISIIMRMRLLHISTGNELKSSVSLEQYKLSWPSGSNPLGNEWTNN